MGVFQIGKPGSVLMKILQVANYSEGCGGISVQVKLLRNHLMADGVFCEIVSTKGSVFKRFCSILKLFIAGRKFDVFHVHACSNRGFFPAIVGVSIGRLLKKRIVLTFHGGEAEVFFQRHPRLVRHYLTKTDANIVLSGFVGNVYDAFNIPYTIIPNIVELKEGVFRDREEVRPRFISIRSLCEVYNIECSLRAFQKVQVQYPEASITILGEGPLREELESFVKEHQICNVSFAGRIDNDEIYRYLSQSDIMVSSSRFDNMPVSVLEGWNAGLLVIASNVGGIPYMIRNGENGLLFVSDDSNELAEKMIWALQNQEQAIKMIRTGHNELFQFSWERVKNLLLQVYGLKN